MLTAKMVTFRSNFGYRYLVVILAVILGIASRKDNLDEVNHNDINAESLSAFKRASTDGCRAEILRLSVDLLKLNNTKELTRKCHKDSLGPRVYPVGCLANMNSTDIIEIESTVRHDQALCLNLCFSYGHSLGGLLSTTGKCYCGTNSMNIPVVCNQTDTKSIIWFRVDDGVYRSLGSYNFEPRMELQKDLKIAFLLSFNGRSVIQVTRLIKMIYDKKHVYYIHVDKRINYLKKELMRIFTGVDNIIVTETRFSTIWGSTQLLDMILNTMQNLRHMDWDYIINLSESDFPLKRLIRLEEFLAMNRGRIFLKNHNMKGYHFIRKQGLDKTFHQCDNHVWRLGDRILPHGIIYSGGSDWFALPRYFCDYLIEGLDRKLQGSTNHSIVITLSTIFNQTLLPAESFFHTVAFNSEFCDRIVDNNLRLTNWQRKKGCNCQHKEVVDWCGCSPMIYRFQDWKRLEKTKHQMSLFFSRKFDPTICNSIINVVENQLVGSQVVSDHKDSRYWLNVFQLNDLDSEKDLHLYQMLGHLALSELNFGSWMQSQLVSVDLFFDEDRFDGYVMQFCQNDDCIQLYVKRKVTFAEDVQNCSDHDFGELQSIEINHGFDAREKVFRNYSPLHQNSDIVVYHEWLMRDLKRDNRTHSKIKFTWINPRNEIDSVQDAKLRLHSKPTRLSLAHRLANNKSLETGVWMLIVGTTEQDCIRQQFLIMSPKKIIDKDQFGLFYSLQGYCLSSESDYNGTTTHGCSHWTLSEKRKLLATYRLDCSTIA